LFGIHFGLEKTAKKCYYDTERQKMKKRGIKFNMKKFVKWMLLVLCIAVLSIGFVACTSNDTETEVPISGVENNETNPNTATTES